MGLSREILMPLIKNVVEFSLEKHKNFLPVTREMTQMKAFQDTTSFNITQQDIKVSNRWAIRLMHSKGFAPQW
jgi:hypothetical protein